MADTYHVYLARCADGSLYCGIARDVAARIAEHDAGTGARYTRGRGPLTVVLTRRCRTKSLALRLEHAIKQLARRDKEQLDAAALDRIVRQLNRRKKVHSGSSTRVAPSGSSISGGAT